MAIPLTLRNRRNVPAAPSLVIPNPRAETIPCRVTVKRWFWERGRKRSGLFLLNEHLREAHAA